VRAGLGYILRPQATIKGKRRVQPVEVWVLRGVETRHVDESMPSTGKSSFASLSG
jgi:hypothetical protein